MDFPFDIVDVEKNTNKQLLQDFHGEKTGFVQVGPHKYFLPIKYRDQASDFYNFKLRQDDVWITTYPRSGTTVMQEMLWLIMHDMNFQAAAATSLWKRAPFLEFSVVVHQGVVDDVIKLVREGGENPELEAAARGFAQNRAEWLDVDPSPRLIKSHLPLTLLPPSLLDTSKHIYMARNPKDMAVSYYHHNRLLTTQGYVGDFPKYWDYFQRDLLPWSPYWEHLREAWLQRNHPNMLFLFYEDLVKDIKGTIRKVCVHLGKQYSEEQVQNLTDHLHIDNFRKYLRENTEGETPLPGLTIEGEEGFIRKGKSGAWASYFTPDMAASADKWIEENLAKIPDFAFPSP